MDRPSKDRSEQPLGCRLKRVMLPLALGAVLLTGCSGCQIIIGVLMMIKGPPTIEADFRQITGKSLGEKGKKIAILSSSSVPAQSEVRSLDQDIITEVTRRLKAKDVNIVSSHEISRWIDDNGAITDEHDLTEIGAKFGVDYIVLFKFEEFGLREPNSPGMYRGHARGSVIVVETAKSALGEKTSRKIYHHPFSTLYPLNQPIPAEQENVETFRTRYMSRLGEELAKLFYDHRPGEEM
ncbi:MAG: hypothetical protein ACKV0T_20560 [Planctomycetales bacterium]